jgi:aryl-alcohol dehydrogenase-like predicted oxidoreductase
MPFITGVSDQKKHMSTNDEQHERVRLWRGPQSPDMEKGFGTSEETIGRWLAQSGRRDRIVLATKLYQPMGTGPNDRGLSAYHIRRACEDSLRRLRTDHIDLYQMHHVDRRTPWDEIWQAMEQLVREGKVIYVGSSNFAGWDIATAECGRLAQLPRAGVGAEPL